MIKLNGYEWYFCNCCGTPSTICEECNMGICTGGCKHATEIFELAPVFWGEEDFRHLTEEEEKEFLNSTNEKVKEEIKWYNQWMREKNEGCLGVLEKEEVL